MATLPINTSNQKLVDGFRKQLCSQAQQLLESTFPEKLEELSLMLKDRDLNIPDPTDIRAELDIPIPDPIKDKLKEEERKKREEAKKEKGNEKEEKKEKEDEDEGPPCGPIPSNERISALITRIKAEIRILKESSSIVSLWIQLQIPKIEDGNNFGVAVQEKVFESMTNSRTKIDGFLTQITKYFSERGDAVAKAAKHQHVDDYRQLVHEIDEAAYMELCLMALEIRDQYAILNDLITKNFEKIILPRGQSKALIY